MPQSQKIKELREYKVVKSNDLIQKSRFQLSVQEQKIILYLISKIKPDDMELNEQTFEIRDFCRVCGLGVDGGKNYRDIKQALKDLRDRSIWVTLEDGSERTLAWINTVLINPNSGSVRIKIDDLMKPYLLQLRERFTQYELLYTLAMRSQYSIRLYELLKSYAYQGYQRFEIEDLKRTLSAENYERNPDFKVNVLDKATREINAFSDLIITYEIKKEGRINKYIEFIIKTKSGAQERLETWERIEDIIDPPQLTFYKRDMRGEII